MTRLTLCFIAGIVIICCLFSAARVAGIYAENDAQQPAVGDSAHALISSFLKGVTQGGSRFNVAWEHTLNDATVFVGVASFRDTQCMPCIKDAFRRAHNPRRVMFGVIEQNEHGDPTCVPDAYYECRAGPGEFCPVDNIRRRRVAARRGKGPTYGRYVSMLAYRGESYYMMMDSHNEFIIGWDKVSITQLHRARSPKPVLSHYPNGWDKENREGMTYQSQGHMMVMCKGIFVSNLGYVRNGARWMNRRIEPRMQPFTAAGYLFADASILQCCPFDPLLDYIFDGEELIYTIRLFTHGWDPATLGENVVQHDYNRHKAHRYWSYSSVTPGVAAETHISQQRAKFIAKAVKKGTVDEYLVRRGDPGLSPRVFQELDLYGAGKDRTVEQLYEMADVHMSTQVAGERYCDMLDKVDAKDAAAPVR